ncbi:Fur family transcriptional regulator [Clostridium polynesiense]|uniref:Fur family transcriptional regulator n=1 Tax=Clostridium polynesiense TaxID=1325933 RepID=UPI00058EEA91|nr:Fur family transcriptional regulator [Clostridium polynesiense]
MNIEDILRQNKIKVTKARTRILYIILNSENSISAEQIYNNCINSGEDINLSTVYRTLEAFEEKHIVDKFDLGEGRYTYCLKKNSHMHILRCSLCNREIEVPCPMHQVEELVKNKTGFTLTEHHLILKGICEECKNKKS